MANIDNPQTRIFANTKLRPMADLIAKMIRTLPEFTIAMNEYKALNSGAANGDIIIDGAELDGRKIITHLSALQVEGIVTDLATFYAANNRTPSVNTVAVNTTPIF